MQFQVAIQWQDRLFMRLSCTGMYCLFQPLQSQNLGWTMPRRHTCPAAASSQLVMDSAHIALRVSWSQILLQPHSWHGTAIMVSIPSACLRPRASNVHQRNHCSLAVEQVSLAFVAAEGYQKRHYCQRVQGLRESSLKLEQHQAYYFKRFPCLMR